MRRYGARGSAGIALLLTAVSISRCTKPEAAAKPAGLASSLTPIVSIKELMENIVDPQADWIFDAVAVDVNKEGTVETKPTSDDDWMKVQRGAVILAEASNLLKMPRRVSPEGDQNNSRTPGAPELPAEQIQAKIDADRALWNTHVDKLRDEALKVLTIVKAKDADKLFQAGTDLDQACESCHLEYWYPGDKQAVIKDRNSRAFTVPVKK
jgi:cytochrome c556